MTSPMQRGPSTSDESSGSTHSDLVLQNVTQSAIQDTFQYNNQIAVSEEQPLQNFTQYFFPNDFDQAFSCLHTGIGVELWCLEIIWPGICQDLWWFDFLYPNILNPETSAAVIAMLFGPNSEKRKFDCPVFVAEARHGWPRTCNNYKSANMSDLRRHLKTRPGRGYMRQLSFLELCPTCNNDFIDRDVFESQHGYRGELCSDRRLQRRRADAQVQWELLYHKVEAAMLSRHLPTQQNESSFALPGPSSEFLVPSVPGNDLVESPADPSIPRQQDDKMPYRTPYELIVDSDSDEGGQDTGQQHTSSLASNGVNESPVSQTWPQIEHNRSDIFNQDSRMSTGITSNRALESEEVERRPQPSTTQASSHDACTQVSEAPHPLISNTSSYRTHNSIQLEDCTPTYNDQGLSSYFRYTGLMESMGQGSNEVLNNQALSSPVFEPRATQPSETCSSLSTLSKASNSFTIECPYCPQCFTGKYGKGNLGRHKRIAHQGAKAKTYPCMVSGCERTYARKDALSKHMRRHHPSLDPINPTQEALHVEDQREVNLEIEDRMEVI